MPLLPARAFKLPAFSVGGLLTAPAADRPALRFGRFVLVAGALLMAGGFAWRRAPRRPRGICAVLCLALPRRAVDGHGEWGGHGE
ncbi:hypothetical protein [Streptomyces sp. NPDC059009]|uniref:hypothetical protein n=1 Tax=Streptomyces sp. NPDC059009 TaxID=3346694 RepID=UPI0036C737CF